MTGPTKDAVAGVYQARGADDLIQFMDSKGNPLARIDKDGSIWCNQFYYSDGTEVSSGSLSSVDSGTF